MHATLACILTNCKTTELRHSKSTPNQQFPEMAVDWPRYLSQYASTSTVSISSTATMSDLPGPGRSLDKLYSRAGRILELCIYRFAHRCGYGPHAVYGRFCTLVIRPQYPLFMRPNDSAKAKAIMPIVWDALLKYAQ